MVVTNATEEPLFASVNINSLPTINTGQTGIVTGQNGAVRYTNSSDVGIAYENNEQEIEKAFGNLDTKDMSTEDLIKKGLGLLSI